jgi:hypothetical protein
MKKLHNRREMSQDLAQKALMKRGTLIKREHKA